MTRAQQTPRLTALVVHWRDEDHLAELVETWPDDPRLELLIVDNSGSLGAGDRGRARRIDPGRNLGFAGGVNRGVAEAEAPWVLLLNPDARPLSGALEHLLEILEGDPAVAGLVPALESPDGEPQCRWQLQPLPTPWELLAQTLFLGGARGPRVEPAPGSAIEQPAAAALVLRRSLIHEMGGFDEGFFPAWFEDVDFARRLASRGNGAEGEVLRYEPRARFVHAMGSSVPELGYGRFLAIYYRNLSRYLWIHHGKRWQITARCAIAVGMMLRTLALPLRRPRRANSRVEAAVALWRVASQALLGWHDTPGHHPSGAATESRGDHDPG